MGSSARRSRTPSHRTCLPAPARRASWCVSSRSRVAVSASRRPRSCPSPRTIGTETDMVGFIEVRRVLVEENFQTMGHRVWILGRERFSPTATGTDTYVLRGGEWYPSGPDDMLTRPEPSLVLGEGVLKLLGNEVFKHTTPGPLETSIESILKDSVLD